MATKTNKTTLAATPRGLQLLTLVAIGGSYALQWVLTLSTVLQQLQHNANLSSYVAFFVGNGIVPVLFFAGAFFLSPRKISRLGKLYESMLIMLVGQVVLQVLVQLVMILHFALPTTSDAYWDFIAYDIGATVVATVVYFVTLVCLRRTKRWK